MLRARGTPAVKDDNVVATSKLMIGPGLEPFPGYRLTAHLGRGGWGEVWKAETPYGGTVALKFLPSDSPRAATQEIRALQALSQIEHPNLLRLEHIWSCPGYLVIAMELADGSLHDLLDVYRTDVRTPIPPDHLCSFLQQAAAAIDFLNARQHTVNDERVAFRHRDIKPSNLLVIGSTVKVSDFSLVMQASAAMTTCRRAGTPAYAAPEVFQGWLSDRTDQYSLAATYYHLRTGAIPFADVSATFDGKYARGALDLAPFTEPERSVLARALATMPQNRWPSCGKFMEKLAHCFTPVVMSH